MYISQHLLYINARWQPKTTEQISNTRMPSVLLDPSVLFCVSAYLTPLFLHGLPAFQTVVGHLLDPASLIGVAVLVATVAATTLSHHAHPKQTAWSHRVSMWFLMNGVVIHTVMDGLAGTFAGFEYKLLPLMAEQYGILDKRFKTGHPDALIVTVFELVVMGPLCLLAYRARVLQRPYQFVLEALVSGIQ